MPLKWGEELFFKMTVKYFLFQKRKNLYEYICECMCVTLLVDLNILFLLYLAQNSTDIYQKLLILF